MRFENSDFYRNEASRSLWQSELTQYAHFSLAKLRDDLQPQSRSAHHDVALAGAMVLLLNQRHPGLNLRRADSAQALVRHVVNLEQALRLFQTDQLLPF